MLSEDIKLLLNYTTNSDINYIAYDEKNQLKINCINKSKLSINSNLKKKNNTENIRILKIKSEYVGTVVLFNSDSNRPYAVLGEYVHKGNILGYIKYLNLRINILSKYDGFITGICVKNNSMVDYGKCLFVIKTIINK